MRTTCDQSYQPSPQTMKYTHIRVYCTHIRVYCTHIRVYCTHIRVYCTHIRVYISHRRKPWKKKKNLFLLYICVLLLLHIPVINFFSHCGRAYGTVPGFFSASGASAGFFWLSLSCFNQDSSGFRSGGCNRSLSGSCSEKLLGWIRWVVLLKERSNARSRSTRCVANVLLMCC